MSGILFPYSCLFTSVNVRQFLVSLKVFVGIQSNFEINKFKLHETLLKRKNSLSYIKIEVVPVWWGLSSEYTTLLQFTQDRL